MHFWFERFRQLSRLLDGDGGGNSGGGVTGGNAAGDGGGSGGSGGSGSAGTNTGDGNANNAAGGSQSGREQDTYSADYVRALREEAKSYRLELKEAKAKLAAAPSAEKITELESEIRQLKVGSAVETALKEAGAISPDLLIKAGVIDLAKVELGADGRPDSAKLKTVIEGIKKDRTELFGAPKRPDVDAGASGASTAGKTMNDLIRQGAGH